MRKICVVVGSRANYSSIKSAMKAIENHTDLSLQVVAMASALLDRYGSVVDLVRKDGFNVDEEVHMLVEGETPLTMAKSTGLGLIELATAFNRLKPDVVITVGDRFETISTTLAATYMNIALAHTMGGEVTGTIDESIRHAITKFAHIHFPASRDASERIIKLGERPETVHLVGCPRIDLVADMLNDLDSVDLTHLFEDGVGNKLDINQPFILLSQHPVTTEYGGDEAQIYQSLRAIKEIGLPAIVLWPNGDAGSDGISRGIRKFREHEDTGEFHYFKNLPTDVYISLMKRTTCLIGNSSSAIRDGAFIGTPTVNIGSRQNMRERGKNVIDVENNQQQILQGIKRQMEHGHYESDSLYGDGKAGVRIADVLATCEWQIQKTIAY
ncbi:MAG: UDP-N-acetylglucosamine 2-epimerase (hydrolyzing) [Gammaproteobacteria bacterium]|nr:UDP-N-acetylglucosamine 2-epimerase (hydrolyzing) [Gammaproteobacteria bacterium]